MFLNNLNNVDLAACLRSVAIHATEVELTRYADEAGLVIEATHSINYTGTDHRFPRAAFFHFLMCNLYSWSFRFPSCCYKFAYGKSSTLFDTAIL